MLWNPLTNPDLGLMLRLSEQLGRLEAADPHLLPDVRRGNTLFVASDYSGCHSGSRYEVTGLFISHLPGFGAWEDERLRLRRKFVADGRRLSFKGLGDRHQRAYLQPLLDAVDLMPGLVAVVAVDRSIKSVFERTGAIDLSDPSLEGFRQWRPHLFERLLRTVHLVSFFLAGLSGPNQNVFWFTDEDEIAPNPERLAVTTTLWGNVLSQYVTHMLGHLRCGTTACDNGTRQIEDLAAIPDLAAGAVAELLTASAAQGLLPRPKVISPPPRGMSRKSRDLLNWFSRTGVPLKRVLLLLSHDAQQRIVHSWVTVHGSSEVSPVGVGGA